MGTTIIIMGLHLWGTIITIWELHGHNNNNKGATLTITISGYTIIIGTTHVPLLQKSGVLNA